MPPANPTGPIATVGDLLARLQNLPPETPIYSPAEDYEANGLVPAWLEFYDMDGPGSHQFITISSGPEGLSDGVIFPLDSTAPAIETVGDLIEHMDWLVAYVKPKLAAKSLDWEDFKIELLPGPHPAVRVIRI